MEGQMEQGTSCVVGEVAFAPCCLETATALTALMGYFNLEKGNCLCGSFFGPVLYPSVTGARNLAAFALESICACS